MASVFESKGIKRASKPFQGIAQSLCKFFPNLEWDLEKAGQTLDPISYLSAILYMTTATLIVSSVAIALPSIILDDFDLMFNVGIPVGLSILIFFYFFLTPKMKIGRRERLIDKDLGYMLKDIEIQTSAGIPLFDTIVNVSTGGYGECSKIATEIVHDVQSGKSMVDALDAAGMITPSAYMRRVMWQLVNALRTGGRVISALNAISTDLKMQRRAKIKEYGQTLNMMSMIYMMAGLVIPSMGVTLLVILSGFMGSGMITKELFMLILAFLVFFQFMFINLVRSSRPNI